MSGRLPPNRRWSTASTRSWNCRPRPPKRWPARATVAVDSATILPQSNALLTEIAGALVKNPRIKRVEVQGHTDNTGTAEHNKQLSEDRANAVVTWLGSHGVATDRLTARGYGQAKPLVPNVTAGNRAKNRRVQFIIVDQDAPAPAEPKQRK